MSDEPQKYYLGHLDKEVIIVSRFKHESMGEENEYVVVFDGSWFHVTNEVSLKPLEETRWEKRKKQLQAEINNLELKKKDTIKRIKSEAVESLANRMKLNAVFATGADKKLTQVGVLMAQELEKIIESKTDLV
jgi:hypothetical protein